MLQENIVFNKNILFLKKKKNFFEKKEFTKSNCLLLSLINVINSFFLKRNDFISLTSDIEEV
jgi:hypothetical protein